MNRTIAFVDGFNLYHSLDDEPRFHKYKWLNIRKLLELYVPPKDLKDIYYFTALTTWNPDKVQRHKVLMRALEHSGAKIVFGQFRRRQKFCLKLQKVLSIP